MKKKFRLITSCAWGNIEEYHEIDGEYETPEEALEAFGGEEEAYQQAIEDSCLDYYIQEVE